MGMYTYLKVDVVVKKNDGFEWLYNDKDIDVSFIDGCAVLKSNLLNDKANSDMNNLSDSIKTLMLDQRVHLLMQDIEIVKDIHGYRIRSSKYLEEDGIKNYSGTYRKFLQVLESLTLTKGYFNTLYEEDDCEDEENGGWKYLYRG